MKKLFALLALSLATAVPLPAALLRIQAILSHFVEADKTELVGARILTAGSSLPATATFNNIAIALVALEGEKNAVRFSARLAEKLPDGSMRRQEADSIAIPIGETGIVRLGEYKLELTPSVMEPPGFAIDFPGGTLAQFLAQLPSNGGMVFNLVGEKADLQTELPPLTLKVSSPGALAFGLNGMLNPKGLAIGLSHSGVTDFSGRTSVYILQKVSEPDSSLSPDAPRFRSYDLSDYLDEKVTIDQITQAIRTAWDLQPGHKPEDLRIKYHPGTSLLLVNGPEAAITIVDRVIGSMRSKTRGANAALEAQRLESVAEEVRNRRALRQAAAPSDPSINPLDRVEQAITDIERRRAERATNKPVEKIPAETPSPSAPQPPAKAPTSEDAEAAQKKLKAVSDSVETRHTLRKSSTETTPPPPAAEPEKK